MNKQQLLKELEREIHKAEQDIHRLKKKMTFATLVERQQKVYALNLLYEEFINLGIEDE